MTSTPIIYGRYMYGEVLPQGLNKVLHFTWTGTLSKNTIIYSITYMYKNYVIYIISHSKIAKVVVIYTIFCFKQYFLKIILPRQDWLSR